MTSSAFAETRDLEKRIQELKRALAGISEERWRAALARDEKAVVKARISASEKTLDNCEAIARYLQYFSQPLSRDIQTRGRNARASLQPIKRLGDAKELHKWVKSQLIPTTSMSERLAHLAATSVRKAQGEALEFHRWS